MGGTLFPGVKFENLCDNESLLMVYAFDVFPFQTIRSEYLDINIYFQENWKTNAKASAASRIILYDFLGSVRALAWVELECYIRFLSTEKPRK
jgi:hypothetical protein